MRRIQFVALLGAVLLAPTLSVAAPIFSDDFNTASSQSSYTTISPDPANAFPVWGYDYSVMGIPSAPNSGDGSTRGLRLNANVAAGVVQAVNVATNASYSGKYVVQFDAWINVNGPFPDGGAGSTNYLTAGVGHNGTTSNLVANTGNGPWTAVNGENGSGIDYRLYKDATLQGVAGGQYAAGTAANARNGLNGYYNQFGGVNVSNMPVQGANNGGPGQQNGTSFLGAFGMQWHRVTLMADSTGGTGGNPSLTWYIDNLRIGTLDAGGTAGAFSVNGKVNLGYSDPSSNTSDLPTHSFVLIDNLVIVPEPATLGLLVVAFFGLYSVRRR
jgi:PEP-CTERM motif